MPQNPEPKDNFEMRVKLGPKCHWTDFQDARELLEGCCEIYLAAGDLDSSLKEMVSTFTSEALAGSAPIVHAPHDIDQKKPEELVNLSSTQPKVREQSVAIIQQTLDFADELGAPHIVVHPGGISRKRTQRGNMEAALLESLQDLGSKKILLENMPWFYWIGGEYTLISNILVRAWEFETVLPDIGGICLDTCDGYLYQEKGGPEEVVAFFRRYPQQIKHLHVSDAVSPNGEGLQIGEGEVNFPQLLEDCYQAARATMGSSGVMEYSMIAEIKGGHLEKGRVQKEGFGKLKRFLRDSRWTVGGTK